METVKCSFNKGIKNTRNVSSLQSEQELTVTGPVGAETKGQSVCSSYYTPPLVCLFLFKSLSLKRRVLRLTQWRTSTTQMGCRTCENERCREIPQLSRFEIDKPGGNVFWHFTVKPGLRFDVQWIIIVDWLMNQWQAQRVPQTYFENCICCLVARWDRRGWKGHGSRGISERESNDLNWTTCSYGKNSGP